MHVGEMIEVFVPVPRIHQRLLYSKLNVQKTLSAIEFFLSSKRRNCRIFIVFSPTPCFRSFFSGSVSFFSREEERTAETTSQRKFFFLPLFKSRAEKFVARITGPKKKQYVIRHRFSVCDGARKK